MGTRDEERCVAVGCSPVAMGYGSQQDEISLSEVSEANATRRIPSFVKVGPLECLGGSMFQRTRELARYTEGPTKHVRKSKRVASPVDEEGRLLRDVLEAAQFTAENEPNALKFCWGNRLIRLSKKQSDAGGQQWNGDVRFRMNRERCEES